MQRAEAAKAQAESAHQHVVNRLTGAIQAEKDGVAQLRRMLESIREEVAVATELERKRMELEERNAQLSNEKVPGVVSV